MRLHKPNDPSPVTRQQRRAEERKANKRAAKLAAGAAMALGASVLAGEAQGATITVNSTADNLTSGDAACTLREAIINANDNAATSPDCAAGEAFPVVDLIQLGGVSGTITLDPNVDGPYSGQLDIREAVTINGPGRDQLMISGANTSRVFYVYSVGTQDVTLTGMEIANGVPLCGGECLSMGAGILATNVNLTLTDIRLRNNSVLGGPPVGINLIPGPGSGPPFGGGLAKTGTGSLTMTDSEVVNNIALAGGGIFIDDFNGGAHTLDNVLIDENGGLFIGGGVFAAIQNGSTLTVRNSVVSGNFSGLGSGPYGPGISEPPPGYFYGAGGGVAAYGQSFFYGYGGSATQARSKRLTAKPSGVAAPPLLIEDTTLSGNSSGYGGAVHASDVADLTIRRSTISANNAIAAGGGVVVESSGNFLSENNTIADNTSEGVGGGVVVESTPFTIEETTISGNTAEPGGGAGVFVDNAPIILPPDASVIAGGLAGLIENSIVADGQMPDIAPSAVTDADIVVASGSVNVNYSLVETPGVAPGWNDLGTNIIGQDPQLGPLQDNGGPTFTKAPAPTSPVIDAGDPAFAPPPTTDQRGLPRVSGAEIDMGSVELQVVVLVPGSFQFASPTYSVSEGGDVTITVNREGGIDGAVSVNVTVTGGTATTGADYTFAGTTLTWADGETGPKTFVIPALADLLFEPAETVTLSLQSPTGGATLGVQSTTVLTINDVPVSAEVPTLGFMMKLLLMLGVAGTGVVVLGRGRLLVYLLALCLAMAAAPTMNAEQLAKKPRQVRKYAHIDSTATTIQEFSRSKDRVKIRVDGETFDLKRTAVRVRDTRRGMQFMRGNAVKAGTPVILRVIRDENGQATRVRLVVFDSLEKAKAAKEQGRAIR